MQYKEFFVEDLFDVLRGRSVYTRSYAKKNAGEYPVYSAGRGAPLARINSYDHEGIFLSWTTNGYAGYVQVLDGKFSINSDRGLLRPKNLKTIDLDYCRLVLQPKLRNQAVGRIIDGKKNEYTKLSPAVVSKTRITLPVDGKGIPDLKVQKDSVKRYLKVENFQTSFKGIHEKLSTANVPMIKGQATTLVSIADKDLFTLQIGARVLKKDIKDNGIPVFSANVNDPFGYVEKSNLADFENSAILWGIDGIFEWGFVDAHVEFATTDHCGVLYVRSKALDPKYVYYALKTTKSQYGFDRTFRASLENIKDVVNVEIPVDGEGKFDLIAQKQIASRYERLDNLKTSLLEQLELLAKGQFAFEV